jgi:transcriptional regulator with XRE-family HTH domain
MRENIEKAIGRHIAKLRKERQLSQAQLAELVDVAPETISRLERGVSIPSLKTFESISHALDVPLKSIFDFEYSQKVKRNASEKEITRIVNFLRTKRAEEIKVGFEILRDVFRGMKKLY